ncbi:FMN-binding protein [Frankia sp. CiP3]|uniref:FMN-binding protein n=1 Tax=Frankia sp. CiP3 TaxID=2880971 RepID=UPI001EF4D63F|nr:FMN-binding protein [Frankia sp. CiP3]
MRRIVLAVASTVAGLVLLFSYRTSTSTSMAATAVTSSGGSSGDGSSGVSSGSTTLTGSEVSTRWGVVQVQITVNAGRIVNAETVQVPDHNPRDVEINRVAIPILSSEAVAAQNAKIDVVSGATVTSDGYIRSLQSAIDAAHLS